MLTVHPTLLIGPSDWQPERMPKEEFLRRITALWERAPESSRAIVYGDSAHHAELAYLTNFVPKLEPAVALIARAGAPQIFVGGGPNMIAAARPLTWIDAVLPLKDVGGAIARFVAPAGGGDAPDAPPLLIGGANMSTALHRVVTDAAGAGRPLPDATARLRHAMRRKSPRELVAMREACAILGAAMATIDAARRAGNGVTAAVLAGERAANAAGAQDVRTLFSVDGGRTLAPFVTAIERRADPLQVYVAVRHLNYWVEGFAQLADRPTAIAAHAGALLRAATAAAIAGAEARALARRIAGGAPPYSIHPVTEFAAVCSMGLALDEPMELDAPTDFDPPPAAQDRLVAGEVCSIGVGLSNGIGAYAIVSAMIAVAEGGNEVLWSADRIGS